MIKSDAYIISLLEQHSVLLYLWASSFPSSRRDLSSWFPYDFDQCHQLLYGQRGFWEESMATHSSILAWRIPMNRRAWQATVHRVAKSRPWLKQLSTHVHREIRYIRKTEQVVLCPCLTSEIYPGIGICTSWQIDGKTVKTVTDFIFLGSKMTADDDCNHEMKRLLLLGRKAMTNLDSSIEKRRLYFAKEDLYC